LPHERIELIEGVADPICDMLDRLRDPVGEVEVTRLSDEKIAESIRQAAEANQKALEAEARASEAQLALEKFKTPRSLSTEQQERITAKLKLLAGTPYDLTGIPFDFSIQQDPECIPLMGQIGSTLKAAGMNWEQWRGKTPRMPVFTQPGMPQAGIIVFTGLMIQIDDAKTPEWGAAVNVIWHTLKSEGIEADRMRITDGTETPNAIHIYIGRKPQ
jgi:hypothetical protein